MKKNGSRSKSAQNRIDYIVYGNPGGAAQLIDKYGYEPLKNPSDLVKAIKMLVKQNGLKMIKELIKIHPDRRAILKVERGKEDNFCGACSSYSYNPQDNYCGVCGHSEYKGQSDKRAFLHQLIDLNVRELEEYYQNILSKANKNPDNPNMAEEVEMIWKELRLRKTEQKKEEKKETSTEISMYPVREGLVILGLVFVAGILVGSSLPAKTVIAR